MWGRLTRQQDTPLEQCSHSGGTQGLQGTTTANRSPERILFMPYQGSGLPAVSGSSIRKCERIHFCSFKLSNVTPCSGNPKKQTQTAVGLPKTELQLEDQARCVNQPCNSLRCTLRLRGPGELGDCDCVDAVGFPAMLSHHILVLLVKGWAWEKARVVWLRWQTLASSGMLPWQLTKDHIPSPGFKKQKQKKPQFTAEESLKYLIQNHKDFAVSSPVALCPTVSASQSPGKSSQVQTPWTFTKALIMIPRWNAIIKGSPINISLLKHTYLLLGQFDYFVNCDCG